MDAVIDKDLASAKLAEEVGGRILELCVEVGGTITGEHGVGIGKRKFMALEHGASIILMKKIKDLIDPKGLMNPGKIFS